MSFCAMNTEGGIGIGGRNQQQSKNRVRTGEARLQNNTRVSPWVLHVCFSWRVYVRTYTYGGVSSGRCIVRSGQNCTVSSLPVGQVHARTMHAYLYPVWSYLVTDDEYTLMIQHVTQHAHHPCIPRSVNMLPGHIYDISTARI